MSQEHSGAGKLFRSEWFWLAFIVLLAAALRFYKLGEWSLWGDEVSNIRDSLRVFELNLPRRSTSRILSRAVMLNWGIDEWKARLAPALLGLATIPIIYLPLRAATNRRIALISALFLAVSPWHLYWSQNARFYTGALLFYSLALLLFYLFLEQDRLLYLLAAVVLFVLGAQEHLTALILVPVAGVYLLLLKLGPWARPPGLRLRNLLILVVPGIAIALLMALPLLSNTQVMTEVFGTPNNNPLWLVAGALYYIGIPLVIAALAGFAFGWKEKNRATLLFGLSAALPLATLAFISLFQYSANRYVFVSLTSWMVLAAFAVDRLSRASKTRSTWTAAAIVVFLVILALGENFLYYRFQNGNREDWRAALEWVADHSTEGELVFVADSRPGSFYLGDRARDLRSYRPPPRSEITQPIWFVVDMNLPAARPDTVAWIRREATLMEDFDVQFRARTFALRVYRLAP